MDESGGRRVAAKRQTRRRIRQAAMRLFLERGFDAVTTTEIAEAAGVAPATLFNYFATKEDLFFGQVRQLETTLVELVRSCPPGESLWARLQSHVLFELTAGRADSDPSAVAPFHRQVAGSPALQAYEHDLFDRREAVLAEALRVALGPDADPLTPRLAAALYVAAERFIGAELRDLLTYTPPGRALRDIEVFIDRAFTALAGGLGPLLAAPDPAGA